jgi:hypothetical protein
MKVHGSMYQAGMHCSSTQKQKDGRLGCLVWMLLLPSRPRWQKPHFVGPCIGRHASGVIRRLALLVVVHHLVGGLDVVFVCRIYRHICDIPENTTFDVDEIEAFLHVG